MTTRKSVVAGQFYPASKEILEGMLKKFWSLADLRNDIDNIKAIIVPHAGYVYSGLTASFGYKAIANQNFEKYLIIGPSHRVSFEGMAVGNYDKWETVFGDLEVDNQNLDLGKEQGSVILNEAHIYEHSLEVQAQFIKYINPEAKIIPVTTGNIRDTETCSNIVDKYLSDKFLLIVSSDLSHYLPYEDAREVDKSTIEEILHLQPNINHNQACGADGINIAIELAVRHNWKPQLLNYLNSGDTAGDKSGVVGYCAIAFTG